MRCAIQKLGSSLVILTIFFQTGYSKGQVCSYPSFLKNSIEKKLEKSCQKITSEDLTNITQLKFENIEDLSQMTSQHLKPLTHLEDLDFSNLPITHIPKFVYNLHHIQRLNISFTKIQFFDSKICQLSSLENLIGKGNTYTNDEIPFHTFCLKSLKVLDMSDSGIIYVDEYLYYLQNLEQLYLKDNNLFLAPFALSFMPSLLTLDLRGNNFQNDSLNSLTDCTNEKGNIENCQENLRSDFSCEVYHRFPYSHRGEPYRRYTTMTDEDFLNLEIHGGFLKDACYGSWLVRTGGFDDFQKTSGFDNTGNYRGRNSRNAYLLSKTINGKTIREWRLALNLTKLQFTSSGEVGYWRQFFEPT